MCHTVIRTGSIIRRTKDRGGRGRRIVLRAPDGYGDLRLVRWRGMMVPLRRVAETLLSRDVFAAEPEP